MIEFHTSGLTIWDVLLMAALFASALAIVLRYFQHAETQALKQTIAILEEDKYALTCDANDLAQQVVDLKNQMNAHL